MWRIIANWRNWIIALAVLVLAAFVFGLAEAVIHKSFSAESRSMAPTLVRGDRFWIDLLAYGSSPPKRGDVVVFNVPHQPGVRYVKRIVGIPGDRIKFAQGILYVNGEPSRLRATAMPAGCAQNDCAGGSVYAETLPGGKPHLILIMSTSAPDENTDELTVPKDSYFVAGDNRDNSLDSRYAEHGLVARTAILGPVTVKFYDGAEHRPVWRHVD